MKRNLGLLFVVFALTLSMVTMAFAQESTPEPTTPEVAPSDAPFLGVHYDTTANVVEVVITPRNSPAAEAGLQDGDIITALNGEEVTGATFAEMVLAYAPGDQITLTVQRADETLEIAVTLGSRADYERGPMGQARPDGRGQGRFNFRMNGDAFTLNDEGNIEILDVPEDGLLAQAGLQAGDVITAINGTALADMPQLPELGENLDGTVTLTVERDGETVELEVSLQDVFPFLMMPMMHGDMPFDFDFQMPPSNMMPHEMPFGDRGFGLRGQRPVLGVQFIQLTEENAADFETELTEGAYIIAVLDNTPASVAGLQAGDVVTEVNGEAVTTDMNLAQYFASVEPNATVTLTVVRDGETLEVEVHLGVLNAETEPATETSLS